MSVGRMVGFTMKGGGVGGWLKDELGCDGMDLSSNREAGASLYTHLLPDRDEENDYRQVPS